MVSAIFRVPLGPPKMVAGGPGTGGGKSSSITGGGTDGYGVVVVVDGAAFECPLVPLLTALMADVQPASINDPPNVNI
jgi:hypothetical protein